jgi:hypothetical protein
MPFIIIDASQLHKGQNEQNAKLQTQTLSTAASRQLCISRTA